MARHPRNCSTNQSEGKGPTSWSPDGQFLIYDSLGQPTHLKLLAVAGPVDRKPAPLVDPQFTSISGRFSPDGRWLAYTSNESGNNEISVRPFDPASGSVGKPVIVTKGGGRSPAWRGDGKEIFYIGQDGTMMPLELNTRNTNASARLQTGSPKPLFKARLECCSGIHRRMAGDSLCQSPNANPTLILRLRFRSHPGKSSTIARTFSFVFRREIALNI